MWQLIRLSTCIILKSQMTHYIGHVTKVHVDDLISWHVMGYSKLATNSVHKRFKVKLGGPKWKQS